MAISEIEPSKWFFSCLIDMRQAALRITIERTAPCSPLFRGRQSNPMLLCSQASGGDRRKSPPSPCQFQPPPVGDGTNHGTTMPWQLTFGPFMSATSQPSDRTTPLMVAV